MAILQFSTIQKILSNSQQFKKFSNSLILDNKKNDMLIHTMSIDYFFIKN